MSQSWKAIGADSVAKAMAENGLTFDENPKLHSRLTQLLGNNDAASTEDEPVDDEWRLGDDEDDDDETEIEEIADEENSFFSNGNLCAKLNAVTFNTTIRTVYRNTLTILLNYIILCILCIILCFSCLHVIITVTSLSSYK